MESSIYIATVSFTFLAFKNQKSYQWWRCTEMDFGSWLESGAGNTIFIQSTYFAYSFSMWKNPYLQRVCPGSLAAPFNSRSAQVRNWLKSSNRNYDVNYVCKVREKENKEQIRPEKVKLAETWAQKEGNDHLITSQHKPTILRIQFLSVHCLNNIRLCTSY